MGSLLELPNEILVHIHILSQSPALPLASRRLWRLTSTDVHKTLFLRAIHPNIHIALRRSIRRPLCSSAILTRLDQLEARRLGRPPTPLPLKGLRVPRHCLTKPTSPETSARLVAYASDLLDRGVNPDNPGFLPLQRAINHNFMPLVRLLLHHGASLSSIDLSPVLASGNTPMLIFLLSLGAPVDQKSMHTAVKAKQWPTVKLLLASGVIPNMETLEGM